MQVKNFIVVVVFFLFENSYSQYTDVINSNRPSESVSAFAVGKSVFQVESGIGFIKEKHSLLDYKANGYFGDLSLRYGLFKEQLEFFGDFKYQNDTYKTIDDSRNRSGIRNAEFGAKYLIYDPYKNYVEKVNIYSWKANHKFKWRQLIPAVGIYGGMNLNFSNQFVGASEKTSVISPKVMLITQNIFPDGYVLITNTFVEKIGTARESIGYVITLTKGFNDKWSAFIENKGINGKLYADGIFSVGAAYLYSSDMQFDFSVSKNYKDTPSLLFSSIGVSWRFDTNYKEVKIKVPKVQSKTDKKMEKKAEKKKRRDAVDLEKP
jgi:hypothetical protein